VYTNNNNNDKKEKGRRMMTMKARKMLLIILAVCGVVAFMAVSAHAAAAWYVCSVVEAGPGWGTTYVRLTDQGTAFTDKWFKPRSDSTKEALATAFTAAANGTLVRINADINAGTYPTLNAIYLQP
jgi:hypothetical protein